jgi:hypothetical protein
VRILALEQAVLDSPAFAAATPSLTSDEALVGFLTTQAHRAVCACRASANRNKGVTCR